MNNDESKSVRIDERHRYRPRWHAAPMAASIVAHAVLLAAIVFFAPAMSKPHGDWVLAYLVEIGEGHSGGSARSATDGARTTSAETGPIALPTPKARRTKARHLAHRSEILPPPHREARDEIASRNPVSVTPHIDSAKAHGDGETGDSGAIDREKLNSGGDDSGKSVSGGVNSGAGIGSGAGDGNGNGSGGDSLAYADYGTNPAPMYPASARRHEEQGTVTLRVLVGADGTVERIEISESSGFDALDDAAVETVSKKWRFTPARREGTSFESWVLVPIRFALTEANSRR